MPGHYFIAVRISGPQLRHDAVNFYVGDQLRRQQFVDSVEKRGGQCEMGSLLPAQSDLQKALHELINSFKLCADQLRETASAERIVLLVRSYPQGAAQSLTVQPSLLADLALTRIELQLEVFPEMSADDDQWA